MKVLSVFVFLISFWGVLEAHSTPVCEQIFEISTAEKSFFVPQGIEDFVFDLESGFIRPTHQNLVNKKIDEVINENIGVYKKKSLSKFEGQKDNPEVLQQWGGFKIGGGLIYDYQELNNALRGSKEMSPEIQFFYKNLLEILKIIDPLPTITFRGVVLDLTTYKQLFEGKKTFVEKGFLASSLGPRTAFLEEQP